MDANNWCQPEQRGPALETWTKVLAMATKALEATRRNSGSLHVQMNGVASSSASSTSSKMGEQSDDDAAAISPSHTPTLANGRDAKTNSMTDFIPLYSPPAHSSTDGESDSLTHRSWRSTRPESRSPLTAGGVGQRCNFLMRNRARTLPQDGSLNELCRRHGGTPWVSPSNKSYPITMIGLHEEIVDFYNWIKPSPVERRLREQVFARLRSVIHELWPQAHVDFFGSFRTGLFLPTSDIDVVVIGNWDALPHWTLAQALVRKGFADESGIKVLDKAAVPIVKLVDKDTEIRMDISFNMNYVVQAAGLINHFIQTFPALKYLVFTLKQFLLQRDLNEVFTGGVSSYSLILMVISFLQLHPTRDLRHVQIHNLNLGVLLIEFLELYGREFNYMKTALRIKDGGAYVSKDEIQQQMAGGHRPSMLCIEDPLQAGNDIGRGSHGAIHVKRAFEHALYFLQPVLFHGGPQNIFSERGSVLARVIRVTDDVIEYREWLRGGLFQQAASPGGYENADATAALAQIAQHTCQPIVSYAVVAGKRPLSSSKSSSKKTTVTSDDDDLAFPRLPSSGASSISDLSSDEADTDESARSSGTDLSMTTSKRSYSSVAGSSINRPPAVMSPGDVCVVQPRDSCPTSAAESRRASAVSADLSAPAAADVSDPSTTRTTPELPTTVGKKSSQSSTQMAFGSSESLPVGRPHGRNYRGGSQFGGSYHGGGGSYRNSTPRKRARGGYEHHGGQPPRGQRDATGNESYHHYPRTVYRSSNKSGARGRGGANHPQHPQPSTQSSQHPP